jgi:addiction module RelE/StbE family toxin
MKVSYSKNFRRQYAKLPPQIKQKADERILLWVRNPRDSVLRDHALQGKYKSHRSIDITGDVRALYIEHDDGITFALIGTHAQLYG